MNEELKHKIHSIYGQLMQEKKLKQAWDKVKANKGAGGVISPILANIYLNELHSIDMYTRQRLRVCMQHWHPNMKKGWLMGDRWNVEYFCKIGLIPSNWLYYNKMYVYTIEQYVEKQTEKRKTRHKRYLENLKQRGIEYYDKMRLEKMQRAKALI